MPPAIDLTGHRFGRLVAIRRLTKEECYSAKDYKWECRCDCGNVTNVLVGNLRNGNSTSCGCGRLEALRIATVVHGLRYSDEYRIWLGMKNRCLNPKARKYDDYGGRGITICDEWKDDFIAFYRDMGIRPTKNHSVDRRDNDKGYSKDNCYWATRSEQGNNRRGNILYTRNGITKTLAEWCREKERKYKRVYYRMKRDGWSFEKAIDTPT